MPGPTSPETPPLEFHAVDAARWPDLVRLFEGRGGPRYCWCMVWREAGPNRGQLTNDERKALLARHVDAGTPIGLLAYRDATPVGWCSVAPRESYRESALKGSDSPDDVVWSLVCFFVPRAERGTGLGRALLDAAIAEATARGASLLEAYPVDPDSPSYRFMGFTSMFRAAGFVEVQHAGTRRRVMHLRLAPAP